MFLEKGNITKDKGNIQSLSAFSIFGLMFTVSHHINNHLLYPPRPVKPGCIPLAASILPPIPDHLENPSATSLFL
ncbi:hypothetical protein CEP53_001434 [Fusarium sp. AF-6]|nr:hypothetical protein CEP53_001434 [Fusarium sp. AF-6]